MIDVETYGAAVGAAKKYTDEHSGSDDAVKYTEQSLTDTQKTQARTNIGAAAAEELPTPEQEAAWSAQADWNEGSGSSASFINNKPMIQKGSGTGGNIEGGTGITQGVNMTRYANSVAYGNITSATANYAFAFGERAFAGNYNRSTGKHAVAIGNNVRAEKDYEVAYGKFNQSNTDTAFSFGDGTSDNDRHNLMELKTDGQMFLNGNAVKTEDEDNYLWLGRICAAYVNPAASSNLKAYNIAFGFGGVFGTDSTVTAIDFSVAQITSQTSIYRAFVFGDFIGYRAENTSTTIYVKSISGSSITDGKIHIKNGKGMFNGCAALRTLNLSLFDTSKTKDMSNMFSNCGALTTIDLSTFDTSNVKSMFGMFGSCTALRNLDLSTFDLTNVTNYNQMLGNTRITTLKCPKINPHNDIPLPRTLYSQDGTAYTNLPVTTGTSIELRQSWT